MKKRLKIVWNKAKIIAGVMLADEWLVVVKAGSEDVTVGCHIGDHTLLEAEKIIEAIKWKDDPEDWDSMPEVENL